MTVRRRAFLYPYWPIYLKDLGLDTAEVLRAARLPADIFLRDAPLVDIQEYFRFWEAVDALSSDPAIPLKFAILRPESFSPPIVAFLYSANLNAALERYVQFRPLIGPTHYSLRKDPHETQIIMESVVDGVPVPAALIATAHVFIVNLVRLATRKHITPQSVEIHSSLNAKEQYEEFFGCPVTQSDVSRLAFARHDTELPFATANPMLWRSIENGLRLQMNELGHLGSMCERVRNWLTHSVAEGRTSMEEAASSLGVSTRTLQRRLREEGSSFKNELNALREQLARHYLTSTRLSTSEIAYRLGYSDSSSFFRAFHEWTNMTPDAVRSDRVA